MPNETAVPRLRIGISTCLLGEPVRFDAGHKRDAFLVDVLGRYVDWISVCPEFEMGLGVPRDSLHLADNGEGVRLVVSKTGADLSAQAARFSAARLAALSDMRLAGYVLKSKSPSCGMERVRVYRNKGVLHKEGRGVYASALLGQFPHLPVEEEGRLSDPRIRENFVTRLFAYQRWLDLEAGKITQGALMKFHERHKLILFAHNQQGARELGAMLGKGKTRATEYLIRFTDVMRRLPTRRNHANVLQHMAGYMKDKIDSRDRQELADVIDRYRRELLPLIVPITLLRHYALKFNVEYLNDQVYLNPHPHEMMLLNHV